MRIYILLLVIAFITFINLLFPPILNAEFTRPNNNLVLKNGVNTWDNDQVYGPSVIIQNDIIKLWYSGSNGTKRQIGYSHSSLTNPLEKKVTPILSWDIIDTNDIGVEHPSVIIRDDLQQHYRMWLSDVGQNYQTFNIYYSNSDNGEFWDIPKLVNFDKKDIIWDAKGVGAPSVLFDIKQKVYRMWYVANGMWNSSTRWRIGYAESDDGIKWTKHPEPVMEADQVWEGVDVGNPTVLYEDGIYHMWYHGDRDIGHAISDDGIKWEKDKNNPVLTPSTDENAFDRRRVLNPFVLRRDDKYYMWYTGQNKDGRWQIGLAAESLMPSPTSTPTPTNTPSPTPTPTPTSTPVPTNTPTPSLSPTVIPSPSSFSPIILIPGLGASWNPHALFSCDLKNSSSWKLAPYVSVYKRLIKTLTKNAGLQLDRDVYVYGYDWRQDLDTDSGNLRNYIDGILKNKPKGTKVRLIGHSLGGLVIRSLLTDYSDISNIESVLTVGTPHQGTLLSYQIWEKGEIPIDDRVMRIAINNLINICKLKLHPTISRVSGFPEIKVKSNREIIQYILPVMKQLLPVFDYIRIKGDIVDSDTLLNQNNWINKHPDFISDILINTISGNNNPTLRYLNVTEPSGKEKTNGDWQDGKPISWDKVNEGDGTVLTVSSQVSHANNTIIDGDHGQIVYSADGIQHILQYLDLKDVKIAAEEPIPEIESKSVLTVSSDNTSEMTLFDPKRNMSQSKDNINVVYNPIAGVYRLKIQAKENDISNLYISFLSDDENNLSKYFQIKTPKNKISEYLISFTNLKTPNLNLIPLK